MRPLSRVIQLQHGCPSQRKGANTAIEARLQVLSDVGLPPTTATKRSRRAGYYTNETHLHRVLKPCGLQQQQTASTGLSVFELRRGDALAPLYALQSPGKVLLKSLSPKSLEGGVDYTKLTSEFGRYI